MSVAKGADVLVHYVPDYERRNGKPPRVGCGRRGRGRTTVYLRNVTCRGCIAWISDWLVERSNELEKAEALAREVKALLLAAEEQMR